MQLTVQDKNEFLKAALKSTDRDIADWLVSVVDALDMLPEDKASAKVPVFARPVPNGMKTRPVQQGDFDPARYQISAPLR